jgi:hypothetical protein
VRQSNLGGKVAEGFSNESWCGPARKSSRADSQILVQSDGGISMSTIVLVLLVLLLLGALPTWPYSRSWGYYPSGGLGLVVVIVLVLLLAGRI